MPERDVLMAKKGVKYMHVLLAWLWKLYFSLLSGSASFSLCCADESTKDEIVLSAD